MYTRCRFQSLWGAITRMRRKKGNRSRNYFVDGESLDVIDSFCLSRHHDRIHGYHDRTIQRKKAVEGAGIMSKLLEEAQGSYKTQNSLPDFFQAPTSYITKFINYVCTSWKSNRSTSFSPSLTPTSTTNLTASFFGMILDRFRNDLLLCWSMAKRPSRNYR
jgi:hypothetical protein